MIKLKLIQQPYITATHYEAYAVNVDDIDQDALRQAYKVTWDIYDFDDDNEPTDESDMCDWSTYKVYDGDKEIEAVIEYDENGLKY